MAPHTDTRTVGSVPAELRWLVHLRWFAGVVILVGAIGHGIWGGWTGTHTAAAALGLVVLLYNAAFWLSSRPDDVIETGRGDVPVAAVQIALDLGTLTALTLFTGGIASPLLGLFVLHMVLGSLLLPRGPAYGVAMFAIGLMLAGLALGGALPQNSAMVMAALGWSVTLLLTVFLTEHITANLRRQEAARRQQHRQTQAILDTAVDGIITIDERGMIVSANPAVQRLFGYSPAEIVGRNVSVLMPEPYRSEHDGYLARYLTTGEARIIGIGRELTIQRKDGMLVPIELAVSEVPVDTGRMFTGIVHDISERRRTESELRALNESLRKHQQALIQHEKMAAMGQMAAGVAHEISNPLASMDSLLQLLQRQPARFTPENIRVLREQVERITHIVRELTAFAHPSGAGWNTMPLKDVIRGALEMVRFDHRIRRVRITCDCDDAVMVRVMPQSLQQVLVNLILNALDAMKECPEPRLSIQVHAAQANGDCHVVEVADSGQGIASEHLSRIFEPFFTTKPLGQGTGLGLSISYSLIERHNGRIEVTSTPGKGTTFRIYLPRLDRDRSDVGGRVAPGPAAHCPRESAGGGVPETGKCIR